MTYLEAEKDILNLDLPDEIIDVMLEILEDFEPDFEPEQCIICCGSGEGQHDGSTCQVCKGHGEVIVEHMTDRNYGIKVKNASVPIKYRAQEKVMKIAKEHDFLTKKITEARALVDASKSRSSATDIKMAISIFCDDVEFKTSVINTHELIKFVNSEINNLAKKLALLDLQLKEINNI